VSAILITISDNLEDERNKPKPTIEMVTLKQLGAELKVDRAKRANLSPFGLRSSIRPIVIEFYSVRRRHGIKIIPHSASI
jgi:hypothetical protein